MADNNITVKLTKATEKIRQESETFNQLKKHDREWFILRLAMGYCSIAILLGILGISGWILFHYQSFPEGVVTSAGIAMFGDVLGVIVTIWKVVLNPEFSTKLQPTIKDK